jgi:hypothetical protein
MTADDRRRRNIRQKPESRNQNTKQNLGRQATMSAPSSSSFWRFLAFFLGFLVLVQWALFTIVLNQHPTEPSPQHDDVKLSRLPDHQARKTTAIDPVATKDVPVTSSPSSSSSVEGVAITLMLRAPKWFHRRYTVMLHNTLANIPDTWTVQIFGNLAWLEKDVFPLHPGLQRMLQSNSTSSTRPNRIILTPLPKDLTKQKPKQIMKSPWLWESVVAEHVLVFSGNGAFCANTPNRLLDFIDYDFVGKPSKHSGGDGSTHSMRRKSRMLEILRDHPPTPKEQTDDVDWVYFTRYMSRNKTRYPIAPLEVQEQFGGAVASSEHPPLIVSGTLAHLNWTAREAFLQTCPELKIIFPSLHEPACFGAHPNGTKCKATICALRDKIPGPGC